MKNEFAKAKAKEGGEEYGCLALVGEGKQLCPIGVRGAEL